VKTVASIICSIAFIWAQAISCEQTPLPPGAKPSCGCGGKMACCAAHQAPVSPPPTANLVPAGTQFQLSVPPQNSAAWVLPDAMLARLSPAASTPITLTRTALYARDCARLI